LILKVIFNMVRAVTFGALRTPSRAFCATAPASRAPAGASIADAIGHGDLPGIAYVIADGEIVVSGRSRQTPPPKRKLFFCCCDVHAGSFTAQ